MAVDLVRRALDREIGELRAGGRFHVVELGVEGLILWDISRDRNGTPLAEHAPPVATVPGGGDIRHDLGFRRLLDSGVPVIFVRSSATPSAERVVEQFRRLDANFEALVSVGSFEDALRDSIRNSSLVKGYELVLLKKTPNGWLEFEPVLLFPADSHYPEAPPKTVRLTCARSDEQGIVFAVVTTEGARGFELMSVQSADLDPGEYEITVELLRPGRVRFHGFPDSVKVRDDRRRWRELVRAVPRKLESPVAAHLICLVEVSGTSDQVKKRVDRVKELLRHAEFSGGALVVSIVSYGAHSFERKVRDEPAVERAWAVTSAEAIAALDKLELHVPVTADYPYAAQLECALMHIASKVKTGHGRPVLLVAGGRRAHPPRTDHKSDILPCPSRTDWSRQLGEIVRKHPQLTVGVIYDQGAADDAFWNEFGATALCGSDAVEAWRFAADLGIGGPPVYVPFPLTGQDGD